MWSVTGKPPEVLEATVLTALPREFRQPRPTSWATANKGGRQVDSFLEGPSFDRLGNLYVTDIPYGRVFRIAPDLQWSLVAEYDGWPNGIAIHRDGKLWVTDYRHGLLAMDPATGARETMLGHRNTESFRGVNDLTFDSAGNCYFTDQGQTGMHDPTGRVYRLRPSGQLDCLLENVPSPNGIAIDEHRQALYVAVTRGNCVWRGPLQRDGTVTKVAAFQTFFGTSGPDGLALDVEGGLAMAHGSLGCAFVMNARGEVTHVVRSPSGAMVTNVAYRPGTSQLLMTESETGSILQATLPTRGAGLYSHREAGDVSRE